MSAALMNDRRVTVETDDDVVLAYWWCGFSWSCSYHARDRVNRQFDNRPFCLTCDQCYWISQRHGPWDESSNGYGALLELEPGVLAISYDEYSSSGSDSRMLSRLRRCRIAIK